MIYRKIGGIHWLALGRLRFTFCIKRTKTTGNTTASLDLILRPKVRPYKRLPHINPDENINDFYHWIS